MLLLNNWATPMHRGYRGEVLSVPVYRDASRVHNQPFYMLKWDSEGLPDSPALLGVVLPFQMAQLPPGLAGISNPAVIAIRD